MNVVGTSARREETTAVAAIDETETSGGTEKMTEAETEEDWLADIRQLAVRHIETCGKVYTDAVIDDDFIDNEVYCAELNYCNQDVPA